jgi:ketosteroid isomerase-like protein
MPTKQRVLDFVAHVERGDIIPALERFYADDVVMQQTDGTTTAGRDANIARERDFFGSITVHQHRAISVVVDGDRAAINWLLEFTGGDGVRYRMDQIAFQTWRGDRIAHERFFYDAAGIAA